MHLTIYDVAKKAGVSISTVSRVINNSSPVSDELRRKVNEAIKKLNYQPNALAQSLIKAETGTVGLIIPDISNPFFSLLAKGAEELAKIHNYSLILCNSNDDPKAETEYIDVLLKKQVDGLIFTGTRCKNEYINQLAENRFPIVVVDREIEEGKDVNSIYTNNKDGAYQATKYLTHLGRKDIAYIAGYPDVKTDKDRFEGYKRALREAKISFREDLVVIGNYHWNDAYNVVKKLLEKGKSFSAVFAANDLMAMGAIKALEENNLKVPDDVSVIGFDDILFASIVNPPLTTVAQPTYQMGESAMRLLIDVIKKRITKPRKVVLETRLIIRESCKRRE